MKEKKSQKIEEHRIYRNKPQTLAILIDAQIEEDLWGRRTGKSVRLAEWLKKRSEQMPRCNLTLLTTTYTHMKNKILPEIQKSWEDMGWIENVHYWKEKYPPVHLGIKLPYRLPPPKNAIFTIQGTVIKLASMNKNAPGAGDASDGMAVDEGRLIDGQRLQVEIFPTVSGTHTKWQGKPYHCSILICSDKPRDAKGRWLYEYRKQVNNTKVKQILDIQYFNQKLLIEKNAGVSKKREKEIDKQVELFEKALEKLRVGLVYVSEASTFDNVHVLGTNAILNLRKNTNKRNFAISVRNEDGEQVENNFYEDIQINVHGYHAINFKRVEANATLNAKLNSFSSVNFSSFKDSLTYQCFNDIDPNIGLDFAIDWNMGGCSCAVRQMIGNDWKLIAFFFVLAPEDHKDLIPKVCNYFAQHPTKKIRFIYNHTFTAGKKFDRPYIALECMQAIKKKKWQVEDCELGQAWTHKKVRHFWKKLLRGRSQYSMSFNIETTGVFYDVAKNVQVVHSDSKGLKKNKAPEKDGTVPYWQAPHPSEAVDQFIQFDFQGEEYEDTNEEENWGI